MKTKSERRILMSGQSTYLVVRVVIGFARQGICGQCKLPSNAGPPKWSCGCSAVEVRGDGNPRIKPGVLEPLETTTQNSKAARSSTLVTRQREAKPGNKGSAKLNPQGKIGKWR